MKLTNLLLTGLVALALGACSSSDDTNVTEKTGDGRLSFSIGFPTSRATTVTAGTEDPNAGTDFEQTFNTASVRVVGDGMNYVYGFTKDDFTKADNVYTLKADKAMQVKAGVSAVVYVTLNGNGTDDANTTVTGTLTNAYTTAPAAVTGYAAPTMLDALQADVAKIKTIAAGETAGTGNFEMTGISDAVTTVANSTVTAPVNVNRVVAKIQENSASNLNAFTFKVLDKRTATTATTDVTVTLTDYSFLNLNKTSNIYAASTAFAPTAETGWFQYSAMNHSNATAWGVSKAITKTSTSDATANNGITYCFENDAAHPTYVVYKAVANSGSTFFTVKNAAGNVVFYPNFTAMDADNGNGYTQLGLSPDSSFDDFAAVGVTKYTSGVCYYVAPIQTGATQKIVRNNWYKLNVTGITAIGSAVIDPIPVINPALLSLTITVMPWTVNTNSIVF